MIGRPGSRLLSYFNGVRDTQEVEKFLWQLENYFKYCRVKSDKNKINNVVFYLFEMAMLWWRRKNAEIGKKACTINTCMKFCEKFKKDFFLNNVVYKVKHKFRN